MNISFANNEYHCDNVAGSEYFSLAGQSTAPLSSDTALMFQSGYSFDVFTVGNLGDTGRNCFYYLPFNALALGKVDYVALEDVKQSGQQGISDLSANTLFFMPAKGNYDRIFGICIANSQENRLFVNHYHEILIGVTTVATDEGINTYPQTTTRQDWSRRKQRSVFIDLKSVNYTFFEEIWNEERTEIVRTVQLSADYQTMRNFNYVFPNEFANIDKDRPFISMGQTQVYSNRTARYYDDKLTYFGYGVDTVPTVFIGGNNNTKFSDSNGTIKIKHFSTPFNFVVEDVINSYITLRGQLEFDYLGLEETEQ